MSSDNAVMAQAKTGLSGDSVPEVVADGISGSRLRVRPLGHEFLACGELQAVTGASDFSTVCNTSCMASGDTP
jgi:hypothetical protein